ncbi:MAG TPA: SAM-dependent methyltransferase [Verrucomicrobiae bacterium]|jgi:methyltransferase (TIGR00027 family)|nr:SAM-dependent methyltransferase [Verrucomicrobiae bacterium]
MALEKKQSHKCSLMAALLSGLIWIAFLPVWLVVIILYEAHVILSSRKLGVSRTALWPMSTRWLQHKLGVRRDEACAKLIKVLPNHSYIGMCAAAFPVLLRRRLTGFVPKMLRYPYEGIPPIGHMNGVRATFVDAAIERYLPGVDQFVELGVGYDTRTVQLQHDRRIRCFEVDLPKTLQMKRELLDQCGVDTSGVKFVPANFLTDHWLDNLAQAGFDPRKPTFFLWEGVKYYLSREAMEETFRTIATMATGSVVVFDYATDANLKAYRKPLCHLDKAILKTVREPQTFWISSEPPVKKNLAALMDGYGLSLREHLNYGRETKRKPLRGGLAAAVVSNLKRM